MTAKNLTASAERILQDIEETLNELETLRGLPALPWPWPESTREFLARTAPPGETAC